jgi:lysyl-tRNA synthetase class 2
MNGPETTVTPASSNIESFTFDPETDTLTIQFRDGDEYDYLNVPPQVHRAFQASGSAGQYFIRHIKGRFAYDGPK